MKHIVFLLLFLPALLPAQKQKVNLEKIGVQAIGGKEYIVQTDTSASGVIQVLLIPSAELQKDLDSQIGSADGALAQIQAQIDTLQVQKKALVQRKKELERIRQNVQAVAKDAKSPDAEVYPPMSVITGPAPAAKPKKSKATTPKKAKAKKQ